MKIAAEVGERLRLARKRAGLSQGQIAGLLDVSKGVVHQWEHGVNIPTARLEQMADYYGTSPYWLQTGKPTAAAESAAAEVDAALEKTSVTAEDRARVVALVETLA